MPHRYQAYGLRLESNLMLPGLAEGAVGDTDVNIQLGKRPDWVGGAFRLLRERQHVRPGDLKAGEPVFTVDSLGQGRYFHLGYSDGTEFVTDAATTHLWGCWKPPFTIEDFLTYLLGPVMGFLLRLRGVATLHAGSVEIAEHAVALVGFAGAGKSTTAAALALRGCGVLCEDVSPLAEAGGEFYIEPGYPRVCLWPDAVAKLFGGEDALPKLTPNWEKRYLPLDGGRARFVSQRRSLVAIYVFGERSSNDSAPRLVPLSPREALMELVQNTYMNSVLDRESRAAEFDVLARLVRQVAARRVVPHSNPERIAQLCDLLVQDAALLASGACSATPSVCV